MAAKAEGAIVPEYGTTSCDPALAVIIQSGHKKVKEKQQRGRKNRGRRNYKGHPSELPREDKQHKRKDAQPL